MYDIWGLQVQLLKLAMAFALDHVAFATFAAPRSLPQVKTLKPLHHLIIIIIRY